MMLEDIYTMLDKNNPIINKHVNGVDVLVDADKRNKLITVWAENYYTHRFNTIRDKRNDLLNKSDWTQVPDASVDREAWAEYRQLLRDFPETITTIEDLENPVWPTPPE